MSNKRIHLSIFVSDLAWSALALLASVFVRYHAIPSRALSTMHSANFLALLGLSVVTWLLLYRVMDLDCFRHGWQASAMISRISLAVLFDFALVASCGYFAKLYYSRLILVCYFGFLWVGIVLIRLGAYQILRLHQQTGRARKVALIGDHKLSREIAYRIRRHPELLYSVVGFLTPFGHAEVSNETSPAQVSNALTSLDAAAFLKKAGVQELIVSVKHAPPLEMQNFLARCQQEGMHVHLLPQPYDLYISRPKLTEVDGIPLLSLDTPHLSTVSRAFKRTFDFSVSAILIGPATVILAIAGGILWFRERRFIRRELRCGRNGQQFGMYRLNIETDEAVASHFHRVLHRLSISEVPQILNVLHGDMSLVGPRPESPERVRDYSEWQKQRLRVLPGMTGLAQVNGLREQSSSDDKTRYDLQYILHWTPLSDLIVLLQTFWTLAARLLSESRQVSRINEESTATAHDVTATAVEPSWD